MFSFLNRTKNPAPPPTETAPGGGAKSANSTSAAANSVEAVTNGIIKMGTGEELNGTTGLSIPTSTQAQMQTTTITTTTSSQLEAHLNEARKNLLEAILLRRTDIVVSLINEWFKGEKRRKY